MTELARATMPLLHAIASIRLPLLDQFFGYLTYLGDETGFILVGLMIFWCLSKQCGYFIFTVNLAGISLNAFLKLLFRVPRPWLLDGSHTIVESARARANDWSFPSGHTQMSVGTFGSAAAWTEKRWLRVLCIVIAVLVPFSRLYLGVHTILDVGAAALMALAMVFCLRPIFRRNDTRAIRRVLIGALLVSVLLLVVTLILPAPEQLTAEEQGNLTNGIRNMWLVCAAALGILITFEVDVRFLHWDTKAVWWAQVLKLVLGLALVLGLKLLCQKLFGDAYHDPLPTCVTYLSMFLFAGCVWPLTFRFFGRLGQPRA